LYHVSARDRGSDTGITAPAAPVDFARAIFAELGIFTAKYEALWFEMFKHGKLPQAAI
jgi:hypothetical protein